MKRRIACVAVLLMVPGWAWASVAGSCPPVENIKAYGGVYTSQDERVWIGVASDGAIGQVRGFESALFYPSEHADMRGTLAKCSYRLERGMLDMHLQPDNRPTVTITEEHWQRQRGPFGIVYFECKKDDPTLCAFTIEG